jgi:hypothetical protein
LGIGPNPQSPIPNPQSPIPILSKLVKPKKDNLKNFNILKIKYIKYYGEKYL